MPCRSLLKFLIPATILLGASPSLAESRLALVIGQSAYKSVPALPNPANDAKAMTQLLSASGFKVLSASDLSQNELRAKVSEFAGEVAANGADTVALVFYAGHGLQIDGENFLVPVDVDVKREADIPIQAVRLNDILNTLNSVPEQDAHPAARCLPQQSVPRAQQECRPWPRHRRREDRRARPSCRSRPRPAPKPRMATAPTARIRPRCLARRKSRC